MARGVQDYKATRDDMVYVFFSVFISKANKNRVSASPSAADQQTKFTSYKMKEGFICAVRRMLFSIILIILFCSLFTDREDERNVMCYVKLAHQIRALDATFDKMGQSFSKASGIWESMQRSGGAAHYLIRASRRVWVVRSPA